MFIALLDSCVIWPSAQRDFLLSLAFEGSYRFIFSEAILSEVEVNEELKRIKRGDSQEVARQKAQNLAAQMRLHFNDSIVKGWEGLEGTYGLPDPDDEHVLAAAVVGGAGCIVTDNFRDFPDDEIPPEIQITSVQDFAYETVAVRPELGLAAIQAMSNRTGKVGAKETPLEILDKLDRIYQLNASTDLIRNIL